MRWSRILALAVYCCAVSASATRADEKSSPFSWLGFGSHKSGAVATTNVSRTSKTPQAFAKMTSGTKRFFTNTKSLFVAKKPPAKKRGVTATRRAARPEPPKQNIFKRLFNPEPPPPPRTVEEWMALEQIRP